jgi:hypothetical protein
MLTDTEDARKSDGVHHDLGDHLHAAAWVDDELTPIADFDHSDIDARLGWVEPSGAPRGGLNIAEANALRDQAFSDASEALISILQWATRPYKGHEQPTPSVVGAKILALQLLLRPEQSPFRSLTEIAKRIHRTKACLSKWVTELRDEVGLQLSIGKSFESRRKYADAQRRAIERGSHVYSAERRAKREAKA